MLNKKKLIVIILIFILLFQTVGFANNIDESFTITELKNTIFINNNGEVISSPNSEDYKYTAKLNNNYYYEIEGSDDQFYIEDNRLKKVQNGLIFDIEVLLAIFFVLFLILYFIVSYFFLDRKETIQEKRRKQTKKSIMSQNFEILDNFNERVNRKIDRSKRKELELFMNQAGFNIKYGEFILINLGSAIIMFFIFGILLKNIFLGGLMFAVGFILPKLIFKGIKNKRIKELDRQIGPFLNMVTIRYENTQDFNKALKLTLEEFQGEPPIYGELEKTVTEIELGVSVTQAIERLAERTENKYMARLADYYSIASTIGTDSIRKNLLSQAYEQFEENREVMEFIKKEISEPVKEAFIMMGAIVVMGVFAFATMDGYKEFYTSTQTGKGILAAVACIMVFATYVIVEKLGKPID